MRVLKFTADETGAVEMPIGAQVISAMYQHSEFGEGIVLHAVCADSAPRKVKRYFEILPTGERIKGVALGYVATFTDPFNLVWHVFEVTRPGSVEERVLQRDQEPALS